MKISIFQAIQICRDIEELYQNKDTNKMIPCNWGNLYRIEMPHFETIIESHRCDRHYVANKYVPTTFWTNLIGTAGNQASVPTTFTVIFNNKGVLPHAPKGKNIEIEGLPARLIYNKMKRKYLKGRQATIKLQQDKQK